MTRHAIGWAAAAALLTFGTTGRADDRAAAQKQKQATDASREDAQRQRQGSTARDDRRLEETRRASPEQARAPQGREARREQRQRTARAGDPEAIAREARRVLSQVDAAISSLQRDETRAARRSLDGAISTVRELYGHVPAMRVLGDMQRAQVGGPADYAPLAATVRRRAVFLDPEVVAGVKQAEEQARQGNAEDASDELLLARSALVADVGLLPLDAAYARIVAARAELEAGRTATATRLLQDVPIALAEVTIASPMVPVRFDLRAAASAAEHGDWKRADALVRSAGARLDRIRRSQGERGSQELDRLAEEVDRLRQRIASDEKPEPSRIRQLATRARDAERDATRQALRGELTRGSAGSAERDASAPRGGAGSAKGDGSAPRGSTGSADAEREQGDERSR